MCVSDILLLGSVDTMGEAVQAFIEQRPNFVLISLPFTSTDALNMIVGIRTIDQTARIIGLAAEECAENVSQALKAGAATVLRIDLIREMLLPLIRADMQAGE